MKETILTVKSLEVLYPFKLNGHFTHHRIYTHCLTPKSKSYDASDSNQE